MNEQIERKIEELREFLEGWIANPNIVDEVMSRVKDIALLTPTSTFPNGSTIKFGDTAEKLKGFNTLGYSESKEPHLQQKDEEVLRELKKEFERMFYAEIAPSINPNAEPPYNAPQKIDVFWNKTPSEVWNFFAPYIKDTKAIKEEAVRGFAEWLNDNTSEWLNDNTSDEWEPSLSIFTQFAEEYLSKSERIEK